MLIASGVRKIHVCAPSNAAVDEILQRLSVKGLLGCESKVDMKQYLLRIGALEYEPNPAVKQHTLDVRLQESLLSSRIHEVREKKTCAEELLAEIKKGFVMDPGNNRYRNLL